MGEDCWWGFCMIRRYESDIEIMAAHMTARERRGQKPCETIAHSIAKTSESRKDLLRTETWQRPSPSEITRGQESFGWY